MDVWAQVGNVCEVGQDELAKHVASLFQLELADLEKAEPRALRLVPESVARRFDVFPLHEDNRRLAVATSDPTNLDADGALRLASGREPVFEIAPPILLRGAIDAHYCPDAVLENLLSGVDAELCCSVEVVGPVVPVPVVVGAAGPAVRLTDLILSEAIREGASDIVIEPGRGGGTVRFRVAGVMRHYMQMPIAALSHVVSRVKILGGLDVSDHLRPQDGRVQVRVEGRVYDLSVSTLPARDAEKALIQVHDPESAGDLLEREKARQPPLSPAADRAHLLVVDDDRVSRKLASTLLERHGFQVTEAADGAAALERVAADDPYDLMVLDLKMPKVDGREVMRRVRSSIGTAGLPIVVLTGLEEADLEVNPLDEGADDYVLKPIDPSRFVARVKAAMRRAGV